MTPSRSCGSLDQHPKTKNMPTHITVTAYSFDELNEEQQGQAIELVRKDRYQYNDFAEWALDGDGVFDPTGPELIGRGLSDTTTIFDHDPRKVYFSTNQNWHLDAAAALTVKNDEAFRQYFGIPEGYAWSIEASGGRDADTVLELEWEGEEGDEPLYIEQAKAAVELFTDHMHNVLGRIEADIQYRFTDEAIREDIEANEWGFELDEDGQPVALA